MVLSLIPARRQELLPVVPAEERREAPLIEGEPGIGKTTLVRAARAGQDRSAVFSLVTGARVSRLSGSTFTKKCGGGLSFSGKLQPWFQANEAGAFPLLPLLL